MFARFRNLFAKSKGDGEEEEQQQGMAPTRPEVPSIVVDEAPDVVELPESETQTENETERSTAAPLASEEEDLANGDVLSGSSQELSNLLEAINAASRLPELSSEDAAEDDEDEDDDDETASTSSVKTKIAKASIERDIIFEESEEESEREEEHDDQGQPLKSLDKIKALIRNDSETYPQSDYTDDNDNETEEPTPSHSRTASLDSGAAAAPSPSPDNQRLSGDFSVVADELPLDSSPSPLLHDSGRTSSASGSEVTGESPPAATLRIVPTGSNELACAAISHKLGAIAEVAESLDAVIRDVQQQEQAVGGGPGMSTTNGGSGAHKKLGSIEDWQSRSTEDESFATASEGNFTPNSHSSSFQTASYIGSAKNSFDEADESTLSTFEIPELPPSPVNMSFDSSELSYFSARQQQTLKSEDQDSVVDVAELHSQSVTPTPDEEQQQHDYLLPMPLPQAIESDSEMEGFSLATGITTELGPRSSTAHTPEVSATRCASSAAAASGASAAAFDPDSTNPNEPKPPASWRRSKYYENITKQTIKGFL